MAGVTNIHSVEAGLLMMGGPGGRIVKALGCARIEYDREKPGIIVFRAGLENHECGRGATVEQAISEAWNFLTAPPSGK